jgi:UDP-galactopyranose mutase
MPPKSFLIVGAGLSGATLAERAAAAGHKVTVIDKRPHLAGNCYDEVDAYTQIRISKYGAHLFHTNDKEVWDYVQRFAKWQRWEHKVIADCSGVYAPIPVNPTTVNVLLGESIHTEEEMKAWLAQETAGFQTPNPKNSEEVALSRVGPRLYDFLFHTYTVKQWAKEPKDLDASVLTRIPVRTSFDDRYFSDKYQALPVKGYTDFVEQMLNHPNIKVFLNTDWEDVKGELRADFTIFTGRIDQYFSTAGLPPLEYRSIEFEWETHPCGGTLQPNSVVNYPFTQNESSQSSEYSQKNYTRCVEYKHFLNQKSDWTIVSKEKTTDKGEPYYPVPTQANQELYAKYQELAEKEKKKGVYFLGRLANYKYFNMDQAIRNSLDFWTAFQVA